MKKSSPFLTLILELASGAIVFFVVFLAGYGLGFVSSFLSNSTTPSWILSFLKIAEWTIYVAGVLLLFALIAGAVLNLIDNIRESRRGSHG